MNQKREDGQVADVDQFLEAQLRNAPAEATSAAHDAAIRAAMQATSRQIQRRSRQRWQVPLAAAATVTLAVGLWWLVPPGPDTGAPESQLRGEGSIATSPADGARLPVPPGELSWSAVPSATAYTVRVRDVTGSLVWESPPLTDARVTLPPSLPGTGPGTTVLWEVEATTGGIPTRLGPFWYAINGNSRP